MKKRVASYERKTKETSIYAVLNLDGRSEERRVGKEC